MAADTIILYDRTGAAIAYTLEDGATLSTYGGRLVGYIHEDGIFDFQGKLLGWYLEGWVVDAHGARVFFTKDSKGGPGRPIKEIPPIRGIRQYCPGRTRRLGKGSKPVLSLFWSARSGVGFFGEMVFTGTVSQASRAGSAAAESAEAKAAPPEQGEIAGREDAEAGE